MDFMDEAEEYSEQEAADLSALLRKQQELEATIADHENLLKVLKAKHKTLSERTIPEKMAELDVSDWRLATGERARLISFCSASISQENSAAAFAWLDEHGYGDSIKWQFEAQLPRGEVGAEVVASLIQHLDNVLRPTGGSATTKSKQSVHNSTLRALVKRAVEAGEDIPLETFGAYVGQKCQIK